MIALALVAALLGSEPAPPEAADAAATPVDAGGVEGGTGPSDRVVASAAAFVGAAAGGLVVASSALMVSSSLGLGDDARSLAFVLGLPPLAVGGGAFAGAWMASADPSWLVGVAGVVGAGLGAGGVAALALTQPRFLDDDLGTTLVALVATPALTGAVAAAVAGAFCASGGE